MQVLLTRADAEKAFIDVYINGGQPCHLRRGDRCAASPVFRVRGNLLMRPGRKSAHRSDKVIC